MEENDLSVTVVLIDFNSILVAKNLSVKISQMLIALVSDDPSTWAEATSLWPRYQTRAVNESIGDLPFESAGRDQAIKVLEESEAWVAIDFPNKRLFSGGLSAPIERDGVYAMGFDDSGNKHCPLSIHLPPWWEVHDAATPIALHEPRDLPINKPSVDRDVLYSDPFLEDIAGRVLAVVESEEWKNCGAIEQERKRYPFTIQVHRDWLMTPRDDLGGRMPRQLLHGAIEWSDHVVSGQELRLMDGESVYAIPNDWSDFAVAPMGSQEMCLYFNLCREVIEASWFWCVCEDRKFEPADAMHSSRQLVSFLRSVSDAWLDGSFEGGASPRFIIECGRRRVPRGEGIVIHGLDEVQEEKHFIDCDCPVCRMMAEGMFGIGFTSIDGHHLELDNEFAFSKFQTREEWEKEQKEYADFVAYLDSKENERTAKGDTQDPLASAWSGIKTDEPLPGDELGYLQMAFMVAEIISELQVLGVAHEEIKELNECFAGYRQSDEVVRLLTATEFKAHLQALAVRYPSLVSRSADLQSRIDESERIFADDSDYPF